jgi:MOSC domain-containing protein YiiM
VIELRAVNVAMPAVLGEVRGERVWSGIAKQPVDPARTLWLSLLNLSGDGQADLTVHGGVDKALYAYPSEHLPWWREELGDDLGSAPFGENLSTVGALESDVRIGDLWAWGRAVLQVCQPRWPCFKLVLHRQRGDIQLRMRESGRTGWYLRVVEPGEVAAAGPISILRQDAADVTVADAHAAMADVHLADRALVERVAGNTALAPQWRDPLVDRLSRHRPA